MKSSRQSTSRIVKLTSSRKSSTLMAHVAPYAFLLSQLYWSGSSFTSSQPESCPQNTAVMSMRKLIMVDTPMTKPTASVDCDRFSTRYAPTTKVQLRMAVRTALNPALAVAATTNEQMSNAKLNNAWSARFTLSNLPCSALPRRSIFGLGVVGVGCASRSACRVGHSARLPPALGFALRRAVLFCWAVAPRGNRWTPKSRSPRSLAASLRS
mmetsp:Transcript_10600/g.32034  ORF Transcript_10600/g.32034 Transcript_10600/m.32034 type:complete len:211 (-) Transcript_10600:43-675(-)